MLLVLTLRALAYALGMLAEWEVSPRRAELWRLFQPGCLMIKGRRGPLVLTLESVLAVAAAAFVVEGMMACCRERG